MKWHKRTILTAFVALALAGINLASAEAAESNAKSILKTMSDYISSQKTIALAVAS